MWSNAGDPDLRRLGHVARNCFCTFDSAKFLVQLRERKLNMETILEIHDMVTKMVLRVLIIFMGLVCCNLSFADPPSPPHPSSPCDIIRTITNFTIPQIEISKPFPLKDTLEFIYSKYSDLDVDPPRKHLFVIEFRLPEEVLQSKISFEAREIKMIDAIELTFGDIPYVLSFEPGKMIFSQPRASAVLPKH